MMLDVRRAERGVGHSRRAGAETPFWPRWQAIQFMIARQKVT